MSGIVHVLHKKTGYKCPICGSWMYMVYWRDKSKSFMCIKCFFGFNYKDKETNGIIK
jgi:Zn ribbon nucleic-acid-binding protein